MARWITMTAKKEGVCGNCGEEIEIGETIRYHPFNGAVHPGFPGPCQIVKAGSPEQAAMPATPKSSEWRVITAKFASKCGGCGGQIEAGDKVEWKRGEKARHIAADGICESYQIQAQEMAAEQAFEDRITGAYAQD